MPFCAMCGVHVDEDEATPDVRGNYEVRGMSVYGRTEEGGYCPACAGRRKRFFYWMVVAIVLLLGSIGSLALLN